MGHQKKKKKEPTEILTIKHDVEEFKSIGRLTESELVDLGNLERRGPETRRTIHLRQKIEQQSKDQDMSLKEKKKIYTPSFYINKDYNKLYAAKRNLFTKEGRDKTIVHWNSFAQNKNPYEADCDDLNHLEELFSQKNIRMQTIRDFEMIITHLETSGEYKINNLNIDKKVLTNKLIGHIVRYWKSKCRKLKRPLLRLNWKVINDKELYGRVPSNRTVFLKREFKKRSNRLIKQIKGEKKMKFIKKARTGLNNMMELAGQLLNDQESKYNSLLIKYYPESEVAKAEKKEVTREETLKKEEKIEIKQENLGEEIKRELDNDACFFISSLITELYSKGYWLSDFTSENIEKMLCSPLRSIEEKVISLDSSSIMQDDEYSIIEQIEVSSDEKCNKNNQENNTVANSCYNNSPYLSSSLINQKRQSNPNYFSYCQEYDESILNTRTFTETRMFNESICKQMEEMDIDFSNKFEEFMERKRVKKNTTSVQNP